MKINLSYLAGMFLCVLCISCTRQFEVKGHLTQAEGKTLYFEQQALDGNRLLDSTVLKAKGSFHFKTKLGDAPEFYRLRFNNRSIFLAADSALTVKIEADSADFNRDYRVEGSLICEQIKQLSLLQKQTLAVFDSLYEVCQAGTIDYEEFSRQVTDVITAHKEKAKPFILDNPKSPVAYFALYQRIHRWLIFDPFQKEDNRLYSAVATSWDVFYPSSPRTKNLEGLALGGLQSIRQNQPKEDGAASNIEIREIDYLPYFDISLPDVFGNYRALSDLEGKVILLDFTAYETGNSPERILRMRELYNLYETAGLEIYQVSIDNDEHFWKTGAMNLPWVCVRDSRGALSPYLGTYNVRTVPTFFLIDRQGHLVARDETVMDLQKEIEELLKK